MKTMPNDPSRFDTVFVVFEYNPEFGRVAVSVWDSYKEAKGAIEAEKDPTAPWRFDPRKYSIASMEKMDYFKQLVKQREKGWG